MLSWAPLALFLAAQTSAVEYVRDIKPILATHCYSCHGERMQMSGLRLDTTASALKGGKRGPAISQGKSGDSRLIQAITGTAEGLPRMPLNREPLPAAQIALLKTWIDQGAKAPVGEETASRKKHWAFVAPVRTPLPAVKNERWVRNEIDRFILARIEKEGVEPSPEADRITLIRRLSLDLIGFPPTPAEVDAFVADKRPDAYEQLVDRLLGSPHHGERWGRHWLDAARYADSNGYSIDSPRQIWKYRDWVVEALNRDLPFDQFVIEQIAGDLLPGATVEQQIATGFHRNTSFNEEGGIDLEQFRIDAVADRVATTGAAILGLTLGCARCHDHKFDPISQKEYFRIFAFLNNADEPVLDIASAEEIARRDALRPQLRLLQRELNEYESKWVKTLDEKQQAALPAEISTILRLSPGQRDDRQTETLYEFLSKQNLGFRERIATILDVKNREPKFPSTLVMKELDAPRETHVHIGGDFTQASERVTPGVLNVLHPLDAPKPTRLDFARWLVDARNPLTGRVHVNRIWQQYFGKGLVETENDFGTQGSLPSHPELLDWLATEFMARKWSQKAMHRLIVTSATYRQSSRRRADFAERDPDNRLLARQSRLRLEAEIIRDAGLKASGLLNPRIGGPSVFPPQPDGVFRFTQIPRVWNPSAGPDRYRRGMYTYFWRSAPNPALLVFDAPDAIAACTRRIRSNTPLQSLTLLNDQAFFEFAQGLAARITKEQFPDDAARIRYAFRLSLSREPLPVETERLQKFLRDQMSQASDGNAAWTSLARVLLNLDEFVTRE